MDAARQGGALTSSPELFKKALTIVAEYRHVPTHCVMPQKCLPQLLFLLSRMILLPVSC